MNYSIFTIPVFDKQAKKLAKKYPSLRKDLSQLADILQKNPTHGKSIGSHFYKIRLAIPSKGKGKSGGARVITYVKVTINSVYLVSIYDKSEDDAITDKELAAIFKSMS